MRYIRNIFFTILVIHASGQLCAQKNTAADSAMFYLRNIISSKDSDNIKRAFISLYQSNEATLLNDNMSRLLNNLQGKIDENDFVDLQSVYFEMLIGFTTPAADEKAVAFGKTFIAQYKYNGNKYIYYSYLTILRNIRLPLRHSGNVTELIRYYNELDKTYRITNDSAAISIVNNVLSGAYFRLGMLEKGRYYQLKSISYLNNLQLYYNVYSSATILGVAGKVNRYAVLGSYYITEDKPAIADSFFKEAVKYYHQLDSPLVLSDAPFLFLQIARCKTLQGDKNSAAYYDTALVYFKTYESTPVEYAHFYQEKAADFIGSNQLDSATAYILQSKKLKDSFELGVSSYMGELQPYYYIASISLKQGKTKQAIEYLQNDLAELKNFKFRPMEIKDLLLLANAYAADGNPGQAYQTLQQAFQLKEKIISDENESRSMSFDTEKKMQESETTILLLDAQNKNNKKTKFYLIGIVSLLGLLAIALGFFYSNKRKSNQRLSLKNETLALTLEQLKSTQSQLIQSEKMASLGELTAGIAHEIQNPLNFVNNFSEVNTELIDELVEEADNGNMSEVKLIANDIKDNEQKINHHGKRADAIVKGMLQHSRSSSGIKEPTDINALCDEYLRLSYQGLRAKDKSFNATLKTDFDPSLEKINIIPHDIGRVIMNLLTNAFYAVAEKTKQEIQGYVPTVSVSTMLSPLPRRGVGGEVLITVSDNGNGIPADIAEKIFQPFFTTKPTGQGTGLGLSLSYDIVKAHGGELRMETKQNEGTTFIIQLPGTTR